MIVQYRNGSEVIPNSFMSKVPPTRKRNVQKQMYRTLELEWFLQVRGISSNFLTNIGGIILWIVDKRMKHRLFIRGSSGPLYQDSIRSLVAYPTYIITFNNNRGIIVGDGTLERDNIDYKRLKSRRHSGSTLIAFAFAFLLACSQSEESLHIHWKAHPRILRIGEKSSR